MSLNELRLNAKYKEIHDLTDFVPLKLDIVAIVLKYGLSNYIKLNKAGRQMYTHGFEVSDLLHDVYAITHDIAAIKIENYIFTDYLAKNDPKLLVGLRSRDNLGVKLPNVIENAMNTTHLSHSSARSRIDMERRRAHDYNISYKAKADMAEKCTSDVELRLATSEKTTMKEVKLLRAQCDEINLMSREIRDTINNFKFCFLHSEQDSERQLAKQFFKFVLNYRKAANNTISNLRLAISTSTHKCETYRRDLIMKSDIKGRLTPIDFEKLLIARSELTAILHEKLLNLGGLKKITGKALLSLTEHKRSVFKLEYEMRWTERKINDIDRSIEHIILDQDFVESSNRNEYETIKEMQEYLNLYDAPTVGTYIARKAELTKLYKDESVLKRKLNIAKMKLENQQRSTKNYSSLIHTKQNYRK